VFSGATFCFFKLNQYKFALLYIFKNYVIIENINIHRRMK